MVWHLSRRFDPAGAALADRHYNRHTIGAPQFVPPGRCVVLKTEAALWVTSWPYVEMTRHQWPGAWINSTFRREAGERASVLIRQAVAATRWFFGDAPPPGLVTFIDPRHVRPTWRRGAAIYGYCYLKAGFTPVGFTKDRELWVWQLTPDEMPRAEAPIGASFRFDFMRSRLEVKWR